MAIWFHCLSRFKPSVKTGDSVIAHGTYIPSKNEDFPYCMLIEHIGVINSETDIEEIKDNYRDITSIEEELKNIKGDK